MARQLIIPFLITANYQTSLAIRQLRGELAQLPAELTALRAASAEVYALGAMGLFSFGMLAVGAQQLASALASAQRMAALAAIASGEFAAAQSASSAILREAAQVAASSTTPLTEVASAYLEAARAGLTLSEASTLVRQALTLSEVSGTDLSETVRSLFGVFRNMGIPITKEYADTITSELSYALDQSIMDLDDFANAMKYVGPIAGQLRVPLHDLFAALMTLHDAGIRGSIAGTGLARMLVRLEAPTATARRALAQLGVDWHRLRPSANNLADVIDLLAASVDELTIRVLLGERAERAFYAILQQGTDVLRMHAAELQRIGRTSTYAQEKLEALYETPAVRLAKAANALRTYAAQLVEPLLHVQLTILEGLGSIARQISESPLLRALTKFGVGFASLFGTIGLVVAGFSWLAGRMLELSAISQHFLMVLDRIQASVKALTTMSLRTPLLGLWEGIKALFGFGGIERLATLVTTRLRLSELTSAIAGPLIFMRRAQRVPPLLSPIPEVLAMQSGSAREALRQLGASLEEFLAAGVALGPLPATIPAIPTRTGSEIAQALWAAIMAGAANAKSPIASAIAKDMVRALASFAASPLPASVRRTWRTAFAQQIANVIGQVPFEDDLAAWLQAVRDTLLIQIQTLGVFVTPAMLRQLGKTRRSFGKIAAALADAFDCAFSSALDQVKIAEAERFLQEPAVRQAAGISRGVQAALQGFAQALTSATIQDLPALLENLSRALTGELQGLNKEFLPFLREYQMKAAAVLRSAAVPWTARAWLGGMAAMPTDALTEIAVQSLSLMTGLAARGRLARLPLPTVVERLTTELSAFWQNLPEEVVAPLRAGLAFGMGAERLPKRSIMENLRKSLVSQLETLRRRRVLGLATAEELARLPQVQQQLQFVTGMLLTEPLQAAYRQVLQNWQKSVPPQLTRFRATIRAFATAPKHQLREALATLGYDLPQIIARVIREGDTFTQAVLQELRQRFTGRTLASLEKSWTTLADAIKGAYGQVQLGLGPIRRVYQLVTSLGLPPEIAREILVQMRAGILQLMAEQIAMGRGIKEASEQLLQQVTVAGPLQRLAQFLRRLWSSALFAPLRWIGRLFSPLVAPLRAFVLALPRLMLNAISAALGVPVLGPILNVVGITLRAFWQRIAQAILQSSLWQQAITPLTGALASLPQALVGADIWRAVSASLRGGLGRFLKIFGVANIALLIGSFIVDLIPWQDVFNLLGVNTSPEMRATFELLGRNIRRVISALLLGIVGAIKAVVWDLTVGGFFSWRAGEGWLGAWFRTLDWLGKRWGEIWAQAIEEREARLRALRLESIQRIKDFELTIKELLYSFNASFESIASLLASQWRKLADLRMRFAESLSVAPMGIGSEWDEIGRFFDTLARGWEQLDSVAAQLEKWTEQAVSIRLALGNLGEQMRSFLEAIRGWPWHRFGWEPGALEEPIPLIPTMPGGPQVTLRQALESLQAQFAPISGTIAEALRQTRQFYGSLPEEAKAQYSALIRWVEETDVLRQQVFEALQDILAPGEGKQPTPEMFQRLQELLQQFAGRLRPEHLRAAVFEPLREAINRTASELSDLQRAMAEILDPRVVRDRLRQLAEAQFEYLTATARHFAEARSAMAEFLEELGASERAIGELTAGAEALGAAWDRVIDILSRPAVSLQEVVAIFQDIFRVAGAETKELRVKWQALYDALQRYNFMGATAEAAEEVRKRLAEFGQELLKIYGRLAEVAERLASRWREVAEDFAESWREDYLDALREASAGEQRFTQLTLREAQLRAAMMRRLGVPEEHIRRATFLFLYERFKKLELLRMPTLREYAESYRSAAQALEDAGFIVDAAVARQQEAAAEWQRGMRWWQMAMETLRLTGGIITSKVLDYLKKAREAFQAAAKASFDFKAALYGLSAVWKDLADLWSGSSDDLAGLQEKMELFPVLLRAGWERLRDLWRQWWETFRLPPLERIVAQFRLRREWRKVMETLFPKPEEVADLITRQSRLLARWIEQGFVPAAAGMTLPQVRELYIQQLQWLRQYYLQRIQEIQALMAQVPPFTRPWLELNRELTATLENLSEIEEQLRSIRLELLNLELYAMPERVASLIVQQGPGLVSFLRQGPVSGISTLNFTIVVQTNDLQEGVQQALDQAQRQIAGFAMNRRVW
jgi:TP901 family phage tail tape measure protein